MFQLVLTGSVIVRPYYIYQQHLLHTYWYQVSTTTKKFAHIDICIYLEIHPCAHQMRLEARRVAFSCIAMLLLPFKCIVVILLVPMIHV